MVTETGLNFYLFRDLLFFLQGAVKNVDWKQEARDGKKDLTYLFTFSLFRLQYGAHGTRTHVGQFGLPIGKRVTCIPPSFPWLRATCQNVSHMRWYAYIPIQKNAPQPFPS